MTDEDRFWIGPQSAPDTYQLVRCLGGGAEGEVWTAILPLSAEGRRNVAVKILPAGDGADEAAWINHGHLLRSIAHPGLVRVIEAFTGPAKHRGGQATNLPARYVVMDLVEGVTLREWLDENPGASASQRLRVLVTVAAALDEMHSGAQTAVPVAHGDVKPSNIVIRPDGSTVLVDLGLTRLADGAGRVGRSRPYAAPELFQAGVGSTPESDRFAFAATVVHALLGEPPALSADHGPHLDAVYGQLQANPLTGRRPVLVNRLMEALAVPPPQRPANLRMWLGSLTDTLSQITDPGATTVDAGPVRPAFDAMPTEAGAFAAAPTSPRPPARSSRRRLVLVGLLVLALLAGGGIVYAATASGPPKGAKAADNTPTAPVSTAESTPVDPSTESPSDGATSSDEPSADASATPGDQPSDQPTDGATPSPSTTGPAGLEISYLSDQDAVAGGYNTGTQKVDAAIYPHSLYVGECGGCGSRTGEYDLNRSWTTFRAVLGVSDDSNDATVLQFEVFVDGKRVGPAHRLSLGQHYNFKGDITGGLRLKLVVTHVSGGSATGVWGDAQINR